MEISSRAVWLVALLVAGCGKQGPTTTPPAAHPVPPMNEPVAEQPDHDAPLVKAEPDEGSEHKEPNPYVAPLERTAGDLTVHAPPKESTRNFGGRLRTHVEGALSQGNARVWVGPQVPGFVSLIEGTKELFLCDRIGDDFLAFYRDPYGASSCDLSGDGNCDYFARLYDIEGNEQWQLPLGSMLSSRRYLEIQDIRYADGVLYYNEACQSYSKTVKGKCSFLVAVDPVEGKELWRTKKLVSNGEFLVVGDYIVSGYGFTDEKDFIYVVSRADGSIKQKLPLKKSPERFQINEDGLLMVHVYPDTIQFYEMKGWDGDAPTLVKVQ